MDTRYIVNHIKNEEQTALVDDHEQCTSPRYINSSTYQSESPYAALNQKCLKRHYDQMTSSPFCGPTHQMMLNDATGGYFLKPLPHHHHPHPHHHPHHQLLFRHHQPYNAIPPPPFDPSSICGPVEGIPLHLLVQEPKFPPQTFDIPDIQDSNSVYGGGGGGDEGGDRPALAPASFGSYPSSSSAAQSLPPLLLQSYGGGGSNTGFYGSPNPLPDRHSPRGSAVPPPSWQQQQQQQTRIVSSTGSTDSSPGSQVEESTTAAPEIASTLQQPHQVQPSANSNGMTSSHSSISRLPNKKARSPKRRKRKDPNEPQKPVSAYSLFFRNAQAAIKSQNPSATFGDVSKIVASMWDGLDDDVKNFYKRQMEVAKKEYLKQLAIYRATLLSKDVQEKTGTDTEPGISTPQHQAPLPLPLPSTTPPVQTPSSQKADDGTTGSSLSPIPAPPLCMPPMGFQPQQPLSPAPEPVSHHHHHHHHHHLHHMMTPSAASHPHQPSPLFYQIGYTSSSSDASSSSSSSSSSVAMRSNFLTYGQKLDHESVVQRIQEPSPYFVGMGLNGEYNKSGEFVSLGNNSFVNGLCREIPCRSFVESDEGDDQKLT